MSVDLNRLTRQFLMNEEQIPDDVFTLIQGLGDVLANFSPRTMAEKRRVKA